MEIFRPSNVEDTDIPTGITYVTEQSYSSPISSPTSMSYFLHRIESATLVREIVDSLPPSYFASPGREIYDDVYDNIMSLDRKYQQRIESLPPFFQLNVRDVASYQALLKERPYLEWQRYLINFVLHTQLARLHRPFLIRGSRKTRYEHSSLQCIRSAETVIEIRNQAMSDHSTGSFTYVLQHFLTAAIILAMDVCFNPDRDQAPHRKQQVLRACRALEEELNAKLVASSESANEDLSSGQLMVLSFQNAVRKLRGTLRKHVREPQPEGATTFSTGDTLPSTRSQGRTEGHLDLTEPEPVSGIVGIRDPERYPNELDHNNMESVAPTMEEDITRAEASNEPLLVDELWDDFFTVGSTFNDSDWDAFFSDVGLNMS